MKRRDLLLSGSSLVAASALSTVGLITPAQAQQPAPAPAAAGQRPNIVFILTDDLSMNLIDVMPEVQRMKSEGLSFSNYFVSNSLCCPSRAQRT